MPHLAKIARQLESFTLACTNFVDFVEGEAVPAVEKIAAFEQLKELDTHWSHLYGTVPSGSGALWRLLPKSLEKLTLRDVCADVFRDLLEEVKVLAEAKEEGLVPNLKQLVIRHDGTIERVGLEEQSVFFKGRAEAMKKACRGVEKIIRQKLRRTP